MLLRTYLLLLVTFITGCTINPNTQAVLKTTDKASLNSISFEQDRQAILAMQGEYQVRFQFNETVALAPNYEKRPSKDTAAWETVIVIADEGDFISLQHLLQMQDGNVIKHWRQDWHYQADERLEFDDDQTWRLQSLPKSESKGRWTQCVYEVSDAPRYCGSGRWEYEFDTPTWTSDRCWRPLPRREYTSRNDYNALRVVNRHTITPAGWSHEQDNSKVQRKQNQNSSALTREFGYNSYTKTTEMDFSPAYKYWEKTASFWQRVRTQWAQLITKNKGIKLLTEVDGMAIIIPMFALAERAQQGEEISDQDIADILATHTAAPRD
ncbi:MAG: hypothetical protein ACJA1I_001814 [Zhongshania marina]|jgi:hypothetical protein